MASLKDLDQRLFENYIELKADPIVGSLEPGIYAGYFDWKDCLPPTGGWFQVPELSGSWSDVSRGVNTDLLLLVHTYDAFLCISFFFFFMFTERLV